MLAGAMVMLIVVPIILLLERTPSRQFRVAASIRPYLLDDAVYLLTSFLIGFAVTRGMQRGLPSWVPRRESPEWTQALAGQIAMVPIALFLMDGGNYAAHWAMHRLDVLWLFHKAHHSSRLLDAVASFRAHAVDQVFRAAATTACLILAGVPVTSMAAASALWVAWSMFTHANVSIDLRWMEPVLVTPRLHRIHHVPATSCHNLGTVFTLWDRLRETLLLHDTAADTPIGVPGELDTYPESFLAQAAAPFREMPPFKPRKS
jgi:sterol desaturase/sphingolipid hydroxylase (fatty acid hydroxylase superfamily)